MDGRDPDGGRAVALVTLSCVGHLALTWGAPGAALAQVRTSDVLSTRSLAIEGEIAMGQATEQAFGMTQQFLLVTGAIDVQARLAAVGEPEDHLSVQLDAGLTVGWLEREPMFSRREEPAWMALWLAAGLAHRTPQLTVRGALGVAPPIRTAVTPQTPDAQLAAGWGDWDRWLVLEHVVPFGLSGLVEGRLGSVDVGGDLALIAAPSFSGEQELFDGYAFYRRPAGFFFWTGVGGWVRP